MTSFYQILGLSIALLISGCSTQTPQYGSTNEEGLVSITNSSFDQLLIRQHTDFSKYRKIKFEPLLVSYDDQPRYDALNRGKDAFQFDDKEMDMFNKQFVKAISSEWKNSFGWDLTEDTGDDVIVVKTTITDLYLYASIKNDEVLPHQAFTNESSKMVIQLSLFDGKTQQRLLESKGSKTTGLRGSDTRSMTSLSSVRYWSDSYQAFRQWASLLTSQMTAR